MTHLDRYAIVFILALAVATAAWGVEKYYTMQVVKAHIERGDCWRDKYRAARFGRHIERKCDFYD